MFFWNSTFFFIPISFHPQMRFEYNLLFQISIHLPVYIQLILTFFSSSSNWHSFIYRILHIYTSLYRDKGSIFLACPDVIWIVTINNAIHLNSNRYWIYIHVNLNIPTMCVWNIQVKKDHHHFTKIKRPVLPFFNIS